jgi:hypothetical protein
MKREEQDRELRQARPSRYYLFRGLRVAKFKHPQN